MKKIMFVFMMCVGSAHAEWRSAFITNVDNELYYQNVSTVTWGAYLAPTKVITRSRCYWHSEATCKILPSSLGVTCKTAGVSGNGKNSGYAKLYISGQNASGKWVDISSVSFSQIAIKFYCDNHVETPKPTAPERERGYNSHSKW
jgi:hypothetical protein